MLRSRLAVAAILAFSSFAAVAFDFSLKDPELVLAVPGVPAIELHEQANPASGPKRLLAGSDSTFTVELELLRQAADSSPRLCAGLLLRALVAQPGMPNRDSIYRAPLDTNTFLVIYALGDGPTQNLHAPSFRRQAPPTAPTRTSTVNPSPAKTLTYGEQHSPLPELALRRGDA